MVWSLALHGARPGRVCGHTSVSLNRPPASSASLSRPALTKSLVSYWICMPEMARLMTSRWISEVPSKMV